MTIITSVLSVEQVASHCVPYDELIPFSKPLGMVFRAFLVAHLCLKTIERSELLVNNKFELAVGAVINITAGERTWVKKGAQIILITKTIFNIIDVQKRIMHRYKELMQAWNGAYPTPTPFLKAKGLSDAANLEAELHLISILASFPDPLLNLALRIESIFTTTAHLLYEVFFRLSRAVFELYEAIVFDRITEFENITGVGVNLTAIFNRLTSEPRELLSQIDENEQMVEKILRAIGTNYKAADLHALINRAVPLHKAGTKIVKSATQAGKEIAMTVSFIATAHAPQPATNVRGAPKQPHHVIRSFDDNNSSAYPSCKARRWDIDGRYYSSD